MACHSDNIRVPKGEKKMKFYNQLMGTGKPLFDVVWGSTMEEDSTLAIVKTYTGWIILDVASGICVVRNFKTKKEALSWYQERNVDHALDKKLLRVRSEAFYKQRVAAMTFHKILRAGDRCTYIDVKDSVILDLIKYDPKTDMWIVTDEWHKFSVSPDSVIKLSEVI